MSPKMDVAAKFDPVRQFVRNRLKELGISARQASRLMRDKEPETNVGFVGDFLDGRAKSLSANRIIALADAIQVSESALMPADVAIAESAPRAAPSGRMVAFEARIAAERPWLAMQRGQIDRDQLRIVSPDAYAVVVPNELNAPRLAAGDVAIVSPTAPIRVGDYVFVRLADDSAGIFMLSMINDDDSVLLCTGSTAADSRAQADISVMHKIVGQAFR